MVYKMYAQIIIRKYSLHDTETYVPCICFLMMYFHKIMYSIVYVTMCACKMSTYDNFSNYYWFKEKPIQINEHNCTHSCIRKIFNMWYWNVRTLHIYVDCVLLSMCDVAYVKHCMYVYWLRMIILAMIKM